MNDIYGCLSQDDHLGFSLLELLLVIFLSSLILVGLINYSVLLIQQNNQTQHLIGLEQEGRFISRYIRQALSQATDKACDTHERIVDATAILSENSLPAPTNIVKNNDRLIFRVCGADLQGSKSEIIKQLYIGKANTNNEELLGFFEKQSIHKSAKQLALDVVGFKVAYGVADNTGIVQHYLSGNTIDQQNIWRQVKSIYINILLTAPSFQPKKQRHYWFWERFHTNNSSNIYQAWPIFITLKNN